MSSCVKCYYTIETLAYLYQMNLCVEGERKGVSVTLINICKTVLYRDLSLCVSDYLWLREKEEWREGGRGSVTPVV